MTNRTAVDRYKTLRLVVALVGLSASLGACTFATTEVVTTASVPDDYRLRHPIAIEEANRSVVIFVGQGRGGLSAGERGDGVAPAQAWVREGTRAVGGAGEDMGARGRRRDLCRCAGRHPDRTGGGLCIPGGQGSARGRRCVFERNYRNTLHLGQPADAGNNP